MAARPTQAARFNSLAGWYGFWMSLRGPTCDAAAAPRRTARWKCPNTRCRYAANVGYEALALELAAAALAGQSEYRLAT